MRWLVTILGGGITVYLSMALNLYVFQEHYVYFPEPPSRGAVATPSSMGLAYDPVKLRTADGETLDAWYIPAPHARATLLYLHGNGGNIQNRLDPIGVFHRLGLNVLIFDYRGYGASSGKPSEQGTYRDAQAAWDYLSQRNKIQPQQIVLFGESLGGAIATWLAAQHPPAALVLYASFTSVPDIAQKLYPLFPAHLLARYRYDTRALLGKVHCPLLIMHSPQDEIIPFSHGIALFQAAHEPKRFLELRGGHDHALLLSRDDYARGVNQFLQTFLGYHKNPYTLK